MVLSYETRKIIQTGSPFCSQHQLIYPQECEISQRPELDYSEVGTHATVEVSNKYSPFAGNEQEITSNHVTLC